MHVGHATASHAPTAACSVLVTVAAGHAAAAISAPCLIRFVRLIKRKSSDSTVTCPLSSMPRAGLKPFVSNIEHGARTVDAR